MFFDTAINKIDKQNYSADWVTKNAAGVLIVTNRSE